MFIYTEIVKTEYYQREKIKIIIKKKRLNKNGKNINNEKRK